MHPWSHTLVCQAAVIARLDGMPFWLAAAVALHGYRVVLLQLLHITPCHAAHLGVSLVHMSMYVAHHDPPDS
jgi:hypothetical protein